MNPSIYYPTYKVIVPKYWLVCEPKNLIYAPAEEKLPHQSMLFHVLAGDYITTLATILRFFEESIKNSALTPEMRELQMKTVRDVISDLLYLNKHYTIVPKETKE